MRKYYQVTVLVVASTEKKCNDTAKTLVDQSNEMVKKTGGILVGDGRTMGYELVEEIQPPPIKRSFNPDLMFLAGTAVGLLTQIWF